ncbi:MAG: type II secretion system F family protein [Steroidobacteraceae bacterium]|jgi:type IV pilus assembly protein PilC|nr:type II secretion system F family protein [Steroidobacteraceae bacterium]
MAELAVTKQATFLWEGKDKKGNRVKGRGLARDEMEIRSDLRKQGIAATRVRKESTLFKSDGKVTAEDIALFARQLATMLNAGIPMVQSFEIIGVGNDKPAVQKLVLAIKSDIETGNSLHQSLAKHPLYFDDLFVNLVEAGEHAGALETVLEKIATYKEKTEALKKKIKKALFYPAAVLAVAIIVTVILLLFVIPQFESLFKGFGADLPAFTQFVVNMSRWMQSSGWMLLIAVGVVISTFAYFYKRSRPLRQFIDKMSLQIPVIGPILKKSAIARYARTLATMFGAGVPLVEAMKSVAGATGNIIYQDAVLRMRDEIATGMRMQRAMENTGLFPNMVVQMIAVGEESGSLDEMASKVADFYEADVDAAVDALSSLLEPMIMVILGVLVGGMVVAMYLPIFKLGAVI